jgi:hypothetical protein
MLKRVKTVPTPKVARMIVKPGQEQSSKQVAAARKVGVNPRLNHANQLTAAAFNTISKTGVSKQKRFN